PSASATASTRSACSATSGRSPVDGASPTGPTPCSRCGRPPMRDALLVLTISAVLVAGLWAWRRWHYPSFWLAVGFPLVALSVRASWRRVALGCGLTKKRQRWWFTTVPGAIASTGLVRVRRRFQRVAVDTK